MHIGKSLVVTVSGYDKESVIEAADSYCEENGFAHRSKVYRNFRLFKWKWEYAIELCKPLDFKIEINITNE